MNQREQVAIVKNLLHREGTRHSCKCHECEAIRQVCGLALEAIAQHESRQHIRDFGRTMNLIEENDHF